MKYNIYYEATLIAMHWKLRPNLSTNQIRKKSTNSMAHTSSEVPMFE